MAKLTKEEKKIKKQELKASKKEKKNSDVPVLKSPTESIVGRIVIWILLIAMALGGLGGLIYLIVKQAINN